MVYGIAMRSTVLAAALTLVTAPACLWDGAKPNLKGVDVRVTFLHTSDIHSRLLPFELAPTASDNNFGLDEGNAPFGGGARLAYLIKRERARADRVMYLDSGDPFQGAPIFNANIGEAEMRFMAHVGIDAIATGNHEFDAGPLNYATQLERWGTFPSLAANYVYKDPSNPNNNKLGRLTQAYQIFNIDGLKIGIIGMGDLGSLSSIGEGGNSLGITPTEQNQTVQTYVNLLHPNVDLVIVLSHLGLTDDEHLIKGYDKVVWKDRMASNWTELEDLGDGRVVAWIPGVRGVDIVFGGHLHVVLNPPKMVTDVDGREVPIVHSGAFAKYLGRFDVVLRDDEEMGGKRLLTSKYQIFPVDERLAPYEDQEVTKLLEPYVVQLNQQLDLRRVIAYAPKTILRRSQGRGGDSGLGNMVAESMRIRRRAEAEVAITNTLGIRDNFYRGPITLEDMFNVFPFENTLVIMYLSGREMQELVDFITERSASRGCQSQAQVAGVKFTMNCGQVITNERAPESYAHPGENILVNGVPIDPFSTYKVAVNDYIGNGGSGFKVLKRNTTKLDTGVPLRTALIDYLSRLPGCGVYEAEESRACVRADKISQTTCAELVDCAEYMKLCERVDCCETDICRGGGARTTSEKACFTLTTLPDVCRAPEDPPEPACHEPAASRGWTGDATVKGPYAEVPCVFGIEDGRIVRRTGEGLDQLPDYNDPDWTE
jgi:5'-nucleotidase / UDP-sugar diphosphatase